MDLALIRDPLLEKGHYDRAPLFSICFCGPRENEDLGMDSYGIAKCSVIIIGRTVDGSVLYKNILEVNGGLRGRGHKMRTCALGGGCALVRTRSWQPKEPLSFLS